MPAAENCQPSADVSAVGYALFLSSSGFPWLFFCCQAACSQCELIREDDGLQYALPPLIPVGYADLAGFANSESGWL
jgi:hypothetical protein